MVISLLAWHSHAKSFGEGDASVTQMRDIPFANLPCTLGHADELAKTPSRLINTLAHVAVNTAKAFSSNTHAYKRRIRQADVNTSSHPPRQAHAQSCHKQTCTRFPQVPTCACALWKQLGKILSAQNIHILSCMHDNKLSYMYKILSHTADCIQRALLHA